MSTISIMRAKTLARLAAPVLLAASLGACSTMSEVADMADPTGWFGSDAPASADQSSDAAANTADAQTPDLAGIPAKPATPSTPDEQKQVAESLAADRAQAQYSAENLQGGTEPVAAPPPAEAPPAETAAATPAAPPPADQTASSDTAAADGAAAAPAAAAADTVGTQVASTGPTAPPATAPMAAAAPESAAPAPAMSADFAPSHAPPLDPSVAQYVARPILSRYQQTAAAAAAPGVERMPSATPRHRHRHKAKAAATQAAPDTSAPPAQ